MEHAASPDTEPDRVPGPLRAALRRWPLVAVALAVGLAGGALLHASSARVYRSSAALLVLKKREGSAAQDARLGVVEDYVSAQVSFLKSEKIRRAAAAELRRLPVSRPLPDDDGAVAALIAAGLDVARDRDPTSPLAASNGVVNLSLRGPDPRDAQLYLDAVVAAYQKELSAVFDASTVRLLATLDLKRGTYEGNRKRAGELLLAKEAELGRVTTEDVGAIRGRVSAAKERAGLLAAEGIDFDRQLATIRAAGPNRRDRAAAFARIAGQARAGDPAANGPEAAARLLEAQRQALGERLGRDHPQMKELAAQVAFQKSLAAAQNPADPAGLTDDLRHLELFVEYKAGTAKAQLADLQSRLAAEERHLVAAAQLAAEAALAREQLRQADGDLRAVDTEKAVTAATKSSGGFEATAITPPTFGTPVAPVLAQSLLVGLTLGGLLAAASVAAAELTDRTFRSPEEVTRRLGVPVLGLVPAIDLARPADPGAPAVAPALVAARRPRSAEAEAYRGVRARLVFGPGGRRVLQVTSPNPGDGKSTFAANLAVVLAQSGQAVALLDADFRRPQVHALFGLAAAAVGLADVLAGTAPLAAALRPSPMPGLDLLPCGPRPANPSELLAGPRLAELLAALKATHDFVIVDTPPLLAVSDPGNVAARVDGVVLVLRLTTDSRPAAGRARETLVALGANVLGVVVNAGAGPGRGYAEYDAGGRAGYRYADYDDGVPADAPRIE